LDLNNLKLPDTFIKRELLPSSEPPKYNKGEKFLKGPIPWNWIVAIAKLGGKTLHVGIAIWHLVGMTKSQGKTIRKTFKEYGRESLC